MLDRISYQVALDTKLNPVDSYIMQRCCSASLLVAEATRAHLRLNNLVWHIRCNRGISGPGECKMSLTSAMSAFP